MAHLQLADFNMHYLDHGSGDETIVFVHGFIATHRWWQPTLERLSSTRYHAYVIDLRAAGASEQVEAGHTLAQYAEDIEAFVAALGLEKFTLVGHSLGGGVAMQYALNHPERLKALVLVDPLAPFGMRLDQGTVDWINSVQGQAEGQRLLVLGAFATPPTGAYLEQLVSDAVAWGPALYLGTMADMARFNVSDRLSEINIPTLVTWGDKDTVIPFQGIVEVFTRIPGCALEVWHGVGHSGMIEVPDRFVELLTRFIDEAASSENK
jgi:branched-chain amino acid transport system permease protein